MNNNKTQQKNKTDERKKKTLLRLQIIHPSIDQRHRPNSPPYLSVCLSVICAGILQPEPPAMAFRSSTNTLWRSLLGRVQNHHQHHHHQLLLSRSMSSGVSHKLFIGGLSWSTDEHSLRDAFSSYGQISEVKVVQDRETGRSKGFGFVSFMSTDDAEAAKKSMDGQTLNGRNVRVDFAIEKAPSGRSFGGYGGGSMGYGDSRSGSSFGGGGSDSSYSSSFGNTSAFGSGGSSGSFGTDSSKDSFDNDNSRSSSKDTFGNSDFGSSGFGKKSEKESFPFENDSFGNAFEDDSFGDYSDSKNKY